MKNLQKLFSAGSESKPSMLTTYDAMIVTRQLSYATDYPGHHFAIKNGPTEGIINVIAGTASRVNDRYTREALRAPIELVVGRVLTSCEASLYAMQYSKNGRLHVFCSAERSTRPHNKHRIDIEVVVMLGDIPERYLSVIDKEFPHCTILGSAPSDSLTAFTQYEHRHIVGNLQTKYK